MSLNSERLLAQRLAETAHAAQRLDARFAIHAVDSKTSQQRVGMPA